MFDLRICFSFSTSTPTSCRYNYHPLLHRIRTLVPRAGDDVAYVLRVINQDEESHRLYIDGLSLHTKILKPGEIDTITVYQQAEGTI